jgi:hypothetical protein
MSDTPKPMDRNLRELIHQLNAAHRRMDLLGYPPRPSATRPIDDRDTTT